MIGMGSPFQRWMRVAAELFALRPHMRRVAKTFQSSVLEGNLVPAAGVEPATFRSGGERSNPLSYAGLNKMACFKEMNQECPPFCPPFLTVFVPLVKYRAALVSSQD